MTQYHADSSEDPFAGPWSGRALLRDLDWVQRLAFRLCSDHALAEDIRQEAALALLAQRSPDEVARRSWLAGIVRNKLRMNRRTDARREAREASVARTESVPLGVDVVERAETQRSVTDAVLRLREPYRTTVLHRYFDGWTPTEISERTHTPVDTVKSRLKRGLRALEDDLAAVFGEAPDPSEGEPRSGWFSALLPLAVMESKRRALVSAAAGAQGLASIPLTSAGLLLMIAKFSLGSLALLSLVGLLWLARSPGQTEPSTVTAEPTLAPSDGDDLARVPAGTNPDGPQRASRSAPLVTTEPADAAASLCDLSGRVIDSRGRELAGASVSLYRGDGERVTAASTDSDGRFSLRTPEPADPLLELYVEGEWLHAPERLQFGGKGWRGRLPLTAGARDVGTIVLGAAGAVAGRVLDANGAPVAGATVTALGGESTESAEDGSFRLERISLGPDALEVRAEGAPIAETDLTLRASTTHEGIEVRLQPAASLRGRVLDHEGQAVAGARVALDPVDRSEISRVTSGADGRFEMEFLWLESAYLRVDADGFDLWDTEEWDQEVSPGSGPILVELEPAANVEFAVTDAANGQPIEHFGIQVQKGAGSEGMQVGGDVEPRPQHHPGGRVVAGARDEYDRVVVFAEGYELFGSDVMASGTTADGARTQSVRLRTTEAPALGSIRGRVLRNGVPLADAFVEIDGGIPMGARMKQLSGVTGRAFVAGDTGSPLVRTAGDGTFALDGLEWPLYRVRVHALGSATLELPLVELENGAHVDLGDMECGAGGTVRGQVVLPPGVSPKGLVASVGHGLGSVRALLDDGANFELLHVPAGPRTVHIEPRNGDLEEGAEAEVTVIDGEFTFVRLDASGVGVARVRLELELDGEPADGCRVLFVEAERPESVIAMRFCDEAGRLDTDLPAAGDVAVCLMVHLGDYVRHPSARLHLEAGGELDETLEFRLGTATVKVSGGRTLPTDGALGVELFDGEGVLHQRVTLEIEDGEVGESQEAIWSPARGTDGGFTLELRRVLEGQWKVKISVVAIDPEKATDSTTLQPEVWLEGRDVLVMGAGR